MCRIFEESYICQERGKWHPIVARKSKELPRGCGNIADCSAHTQDNEDGRHHRCSCMAACAVEKDLDESKPSGRFHDFMHIPHADEITDEHYVSESTVQYGGAHHGKRQCSRGVFNFLRC